MSLIYKIGNFFQKIIILHVFVYKMTSFYQNVVIILAIAM